MGNVDGTLIWYYYICKREVWLMYRNIVPDQWNENIDLGRFLHEKFFNREKKEILFGNIKLDFVSYKNNKIIVSETKKSSRFLLSSKMQLMYYLRELSKTGIKAEGVLHFIDEKRTEKVNLNYADLEELNRAEIEIEKIIQSELPPPVVEINFCKNCGYREYCYA